MAFFTNILCQDLGIFIHNIFTYAQCNNTRQIAQYLEGSLAAGYMAQNVIQQKLAMMLLKKGRKEDTRQVRSMTTPIYQQDLSEIQASFMDAVHEMKTDVTLENCVEAMSQKQLDEMLHSLEKAIGGKQQTISSNEFSSMIVDSVEWLDMARPESLAKLREALTMIADDLRDADQRASHDQ